MPVDVLLPNGEVVSCLQKHEVPLVQLEIESYFANGIRLKPGDTVFDVGANIGLFSVDAFHRCQGNLHVYAFEPVEAIYKLLCENLERCAPWGRPNTFPFGLANCRKTVPFTYYPRASVLSTAYPDENDDLVVIKHAVLNSIVHLDAAPLAVRCLRWLPKALSTAILDVALRRILRPETVTCELLTLSQVIRDHGVERIDILKIDVERAELDVFNGVEDRDWPKIQQIIVDVHDIDGRLNAVITRLQRNRFAEITVDQPPTLKNSDIYTVFARRKVRPDPDRTPIAQVEAVTEYS